jgi:hypothetical protein
MPIGLKKGMVVEYAMMEENITLINVAIRQSFKLASIS